MVTSNLIADRISKKLNVSINEIENLLQSREQEFKSFGIVGVSQHPHMEFIPYLEKLLMDKDDIIASSALECLADLNSGKALKAAKKMLNSKSRYVQASAVYVLGNHAKRSAVPLLQKVYHGTMSKWRKVNILEALYKLNGNENKYIDEIFYILCSTKSYHTQCLSLNALSRIKNRGNTKKINDFLRNFQKRELSVAVKSSLMSAIGKQN
jgi:hypothetical protein